MSDKPPIILGPDGRPQHQHLEAMVYPNGAMRPLGNHPTPPGHALSRMKGPDDVIPESEWVEWQMPSDCPIKIKDQNGYGACNGFAAATSFEYAMWLATGNYVPMSGWFVYAKLCNGWDVGSSIADALTLLRDEGVSREDLVQYGIINPRRLSAEANADAKRNRIEIGSKPTTWAEVMTCAQRRQIMNISVSVGGGFDNLDEDGVPQGMAWTGAGNHAITTGLGVVRGKGGRWLIDCQNSWSEKWGRKGKFRLSEAMWTRQRGSDCYSITAVEADPQAYQPPPARKLA
jgi:hypothetical protein